MSLLDVTNLNVEFKMRHSVVNAVQDFNLHVEPGECVGLVGESGCGKTTSGLAVMRLLPTNGHIASGSIQLDGVDLATFSEKEMQAQRGRTVALIPQDPMSSLNPTARIGRQIGEGLRIHFGASEKEARQRALEVLEMVEMPRPAERLDQYPFELSGGLRQRVIIAMGLVCQPKLLIADEPTTALDVTIQAQILDLLDNLRRELNMAMLLITHDMGVIAGRTDRVVVMYGGKKAEEAETEELFNNMHHPYSQSLLASMPSLEIRENVRLRSIAGLPPDLSKTIVGCRFAPRCSRASDECRTQEPPYVEEKNHGFACFHPVNGPAEVEAIADNRQRTSGDEILKVENLVKEYPLKRGLLRRTVGVVSATAGANFSIREGQTFGLVGESGCGKTTIARMLVGLETPTSGKITFQNELVSARNYKPTLRQRRDRQMMFQDPYSSLDPRMTVGDILAEPLEVHGEGNREERRQKVAELLKTVGLDPVAAERYPHEFSGGQRQRIGLARAIALNPKLVIADEPVSALDVSIQAQILNLMKNLQDQHSLSYVFISHDLSVVRYMADEIGVMYLGKIVEIGEAQSVFNNPAHPYTQGLLDAVPVPDPRVAHGRKGNQVKGELPSPVNPPSGCRFRTRCPKAQDICANEEPMMQSFGDDHQAACHFPLRTPVSIR